MAQPQDLHATLYFLSRDSIYSTVKPYILNYLSNTIPSTNYKAEKIENIPVRDLRSYEDQFTFTKNGFAVLELSSKMKYDDFAAEDKILSIYCQEVANVLLQYTQGLSVHIFDFLVCNHFPQHRGRIANMKVGSSERPFMADGESQRSCHRSTRDKDSHWFGAHNI